MIYTERDRLASICLDEERESIGIDEIASLLWEKPANVIYVELKGILIGIISSGDIARATGNSVMINKEFTSVYAFEYMKARRIFLEKNSINTLPVIDVKGKLLGEYARWSNLISFEYLDQFCGKAGKSSFLETNSKVVFVTPCEAFEIKQEKFQKRKELLEGQIKELRIVDRRGLMEFFDWADLILFLDEDELYSTKVLYQIQYGIDARDPFIWNKAKTTTFSTVSNIMTRYTACEMMLNMQKQGVFFLPFAGMDENKNGYYKKFEQQIDEKYKKFGLKRMNKLQSQMKKEFFGEIYCEEYEEQEFPVPHAFTIKNGVFEIQDQETMFFHARDGKRQTEGQPREYERSIHLFGPCVIIGLYVEDKYTIASWLQKKMNESGFSCKVVNHGVLSGSVAMKWKKITRTPIREGDIVIYYDEGEGKNEIPKVNLIDVIEKRSVPVEWVANMPLHCNHKVNEFCAEAIYDSIVSVLQEDVSERKKVEIDDLDYCFREIDVSAFDKIGSIVMNCNPFTLGHRYLIEEALKKVEFLIIFVVEEEKSLFSFEERFTMVKEGVKDLQNVFVVPSGEQILSQKTFPEYFAKVVDEDIVKNTENDIRIFAEHIAPKLNIKYRFVGEEKKDVVTNEYNNAMKKILPSYGISLIEIPRLEQEEDVISATKVRQYLDEGKYEEIKRYVPESTLRVVFNESI